MKYNCFTVSLVSQVQQCQSAMLYTYIPWPLGPLSHLGPSHPSIVTQMAELSSLCHTDVSSQAIYFTQGSNTSVLLSQFILPSPSPPPCLQVCYLCLHLYSWAANRFIDTTFTDPIYIYMLIYGICFSFMIYFIPYDRH